MSTKLLTKSFKAAFCEGKACVADNIHQGPETSPEELYQKSSGSHAMRSLISKFPSEWKTSKVAAVYKKGCK